jgi:hypothetical protein
MNVLDTRNFVAFKPLQNNNPISVRRRKMWISHGAMKSVYRFGGMLLCKELIGELGG